MIRMFFVESIEFMTVKGGESGLISLVLYPLDLSIVLGFNNYMIRSIHQSVLYGIAGSAYIL